MVSDLAITVTDFGSLLGTRIKSSKQTAVSQNYKLGITHTQGTAGTA